MGEAPADSNVVAMIDRIVSIFADHDIPTLLIAIMICLAGSILFVRLLGRARRTDGLQRNIWTFYSGLVGGGTIWATHFIAVLAWRQDLLLGFDPALTAVSLLVAIVATAAGSHVVAISGSKHWVEVGGLIIGLGIASMHFLGMAGLSLCADLTGEPEGLALAVLFAGGFGIMATNRLSRPLTRFCRYGGALSFALAILLLHLTGIGALNLDIDWKLLASSERFSPFMMIAAILSVTAIVLPTVGGAYLTDLRNKTEAQHRLHHMAMHDSLTGLPNRAQIREHLSQILEKAGSDNSWVGVLSLDLDRFKEINDVHGHAAGDAVLRAIAARFNTLRNEQVRFARFGGDEFLAVIGPVWRQTQIDSVAGDALSALREPIQWNEHRLNVGVSIGLTQYPDDGSTSEELLERADLAMYRAKALGKNRIEKYEAGMEESNRSRSALAMDLQQAIRNDEFEIHYQLQNDTSTRDVVGAEALLRWHHPLRGMVSPAEFIPICEDTGLIIEIGAMVLRKACIDAANWPGEMRVAVNVATRQLLDDEFVKTVHEALLESGLSAPRLELEITESGIIADQQHALHVIRQLKSLGVRISMDDFGTGYSSLSTLQNFPFDKIKIDRSFVSDLPANNHSAAIVRATIILGNALKIPVLAEGVETEDHIEFLKEAGCRELQGFFFGKPMNLRNLLEQIGQSAQIGSPEVNPARDDDMARMHKVA